MHNVLNSSQINTITASAFVRSQNLHHHHIAIAISLKTGNVLASATNSATVTGSIHAEAAAVQQLRQKLRDRVLYSRDILKGIDLVSLRISKEGQLRLAKPCPNCRNVMKQFRLIKCCSYSTNCGNLERERY